MPKMPNPVIVLPGIIATYLRDEYPLPPDSIWEVLESSKQYERASLHPDNLKYEAIEPARVQSGQLYEIAYKELIEELRHNLRVRDDQPVPVYPFSYDWRQPIENAQAQLGTFIDEVIERTLLLRHYNADASYKANPRVDLVGHSMGGLVIAGYLAKVQAQHRIGSIVTLATPFQGSYEAVIKVTTGTANLGTSPPSSREREAARMTPALYYLMPSFPNALTVPPNSQLPADLFNPAVWQRSIADTIRQYIQLRGLNPSNAKQQAEQVFAAMLTQARQFRTLTDTLNLQACKLTPDDWLCVVGTDSTTRVQLSVDLVGGKPNFEFASSDRKNEWGQPQPDGELTGDGTVPFRGALPKFLPRESLVCVTPDDFGYWEIQDKLTTAIAGFHGILPNMDMLHRLIVAFLTDRKDKHGNIWGRRAPGVAANAWAPPLAQLEDKT
ncbi:MAG TPA: alpha/beta hydrolase [Steroidobacteraceae bacterium]|nr:alpha/beta hydrolase [Steroidobacteraceae bacterium]